MTQQLLPSINDNNKRRRNKQILIPIIQNKFYWICDTQPPKNSINSIYFCIDEELIYEPLRNDFGPFCIENTLNFIKNVQQLLENKDYSNTTIYHYTNSECPIKKINSAFLIAAYQLLCLNRSSDEIWQSLKNINFITFKDSSDIKNDYKCTLLDCIKGLEYAYKLNWISVNNFDIKQYQTLKEYDITVIIPNKLIAFQNPELFSTSNSTCELTVDQSIQIFKQMGVKLVIRLNHSDYSSQLYERNGIKHRDLIFPDGSSPSQEIMQAFLDEVESVDGMVAVHCKAGRGRTGTLIGCYAIKHYHFHGNEFIGYIRIMRPGSIHGPQQQYLNQIEKQLIQESNEGEQEQQQQSEIWESVKHLVQKQKTNTTTTNSTQNTIKSSSTLMMIDESPKQNLSYKSNTRNRIRSVCIPQSFPNNNNNNNNNVNVTPMNSRKKQNQQQILSSSSSYKQQQLYSSQSLSSQPYSFQSGSSQIQSQQQQQEEYTPQQSQIRGTINNNSSFQNECDQSTQGSSGSSGAGVSRRKENDDNDYNNNNNNNNINKQQEISDFEQIAQKELAPLLLSKSTRIPSNYTKFPNFVQYSSTQNNNNNNQKQQQQQPMSNQNLNQSSIQNNKNNHINEIQTMNSLRQTRSNLRNLSNDNHYNRKNNLSNSQNKRIIVGRKQQQQLNQQQYQIEDDKNPCSSHSFYGIDSQDSSLTLSQIESKNNKNKMNNNNNNKIRQLSQNDRIFNNLCQLQQKQLTKAEESLNNNKSNHKDHHKFNKILINRKNYIIKQYSQIYSQLY